MKNVKLRKIQSLEASITQRGSHGIAPLFLFLRCSVVSLPWCFETRERLFSSVSGKKMYRILTLGFFVSLFSLFMK